MKHATATRRDHLRFCEIEGWTPVRSSRGKSGTHHETYELGLPDGKVLRTRISRPPDRSEYGPSLWGHILRDQLQVSEAEFWACVRDRVVPDRGFEPSPDAERVIPAEVVWALLKRVGLPEEEVRSMTRAEAIDRLNQFWTTGE